MRWLWRAEVHSHQEGQKSQTTKASFTTTTISSLSGLVTFLLHLGWNYPGRINPHKEDPEMPISKIIFFGKIDGNCMYGKHCVNGGEVPSCLSGAASPFLNTFFRL
mmetsp:Transcript_26923/g.62546  ORF Transcript_26923/g.62546 Transcript_26923/m.62546 type:complete len:106 (+) Transcript_26923:709-1026(+)